MTIASPSQPFPSDADLPFASVVIACRNEKAHITRCLDSLLAGSYPLDRLELLVADGMSEDGTRDVVRDYERRHPQVRLVDNPLLHATGAFNAGIRASRGEVVTIFGGHAVYGPDYLRELVRHLIAYRADQAGGVSAYMPRKDTVIGRALATAQAVPFGAGMRTGYKVGGAQPTWVDTAFCAVFRRGVFDEIGLFDEQLTYTQDMVFNSKLRKNGGRILLVPSATMVYLSRSDLGAFVRHQFRNGAWNLIPMAYGEFFLSVRHLVPMVFVGALAAAALLTLITPAGRWALAAVAGSYALASVIAALIAAARNRRPEFVVTLPPIFALMHVVYGAGSWWGLIEMLRRRASRRRAGNNQR